ncbi:TetR/AcrR family transcriptional regulator [Actinocorallia aurea]
MSEGRRADARRNYARILAVAEAEVAAHGYGASLEQIARVAGVGSATVRRHFPTRRALLEAVSAERVTALCARAEELDRRGDGRNALLEWLAEVVTYCVDARGLAAALSYDGDPLGENSCATAMEKAGAPLLRRAVADGTAAPDVTVADLIALIVGIVLATEHHPAPAAQAHHLFRLATTGLAPRPVTAPDAAAPA